MVEVGGSSPLASTKKNGTLLGAVLFGEVKIGRVSWFARACEASDALMRSINSLFLRCKRGENAIDRKNAKGSLCGESISRSFYFKGEDGIFSI